MSDSVQNLLDKINYIESRRNPKHDTFLSRWVRKYYDRKLTPECKKLLEDSKKEYELNNRGGNNGK